MRYPHRTLIRLTGPDTLALLERTVTHKVENWAEGEWRYGALLTPQGKVIADYLAQRTEDGVVIDVHEDAAEDLMKRLKMFRLRAAVEIEADLTHAAVKSLEASDPRHPDLWGRTIVPLADAGADLPEADWHAHRIELGIPEWGADYRAAEVFPTDINMDVMNGVDYKKGCFVGQEVASRMKRRGKIRKRTVTLNGVNLAQGADVMAAAPIGSVTSVSGTTGLALVRTDRLQAALDAGHDLTCEGAPVTINLPDWLEVELKANAEETAND